MNQSNFDLIPAFFLAVPFLFLLILVNYLGYRFKGMHIKKFPGTEHVGIGPTEGSLLGLTALLLSFTFGMSATKYETRRQLIVSEANHLSTTILRCDMYCDSARDKLKGELKNFLEARIDYYRAEADEQLISASLQKADSISMLIWAQVTGFSHDLDNRVATEQMVPALNETIDIITTREAARRATVPRLILLVLCSLILVSAFLSGYGSKNLERNKVLVVAFALITTLALYLVVDLDKPRQGFVNLNSTEELFTELRSLFTANR